VTGTVQQTTENDQVSVASQLARSQAALVEAVKSLRS